MADISIEVNEINVVSVERCKKTIIIHEKTLTWLHLNRREMTPSLIVTEESCLECREYGRY